MNRASVIMDVDTGVCDLLALALAASSEVIDLKAITVCFGNRPIEQTLLNTLKAVELLGIRSVPVAAGARKGLLSPLRAANRGRACFGEDGLGGSADRLPYPQKSPESLSAVELMAKVVSESEDGVILVACGPLTNLAVFLLAHPELKDKIEGIAFSGGAMLGGDALPSVEFNIACDPEAAHIVLESGVKVLMCGLDVTDRAYATFEDRERLRIAGGPVAEFLHEPLRRYGEYCENTFAQDGCPIPDAVPLAWLVAPDLLTARPRRVDLDLSGRYTRGCTVADTLSLTRRRPNVVVAEDIDREAYIIMLSEALRSFRPL